MLANRSRAWLEKPHRAAPRKTQMGELLLARRVVEHRGHHQWLVAPVKGTITGTPAFWASG